MDKDKILAEIFENDPLGLLIVKPKKSAAKTADNRLLDSFQEINDFVAKNGKEPEPNIGNIAEFQLYSRLKNFREDSDKSRLLHSDDIHGLLPVIEEVNEPRQSYKKLATKPIESFDDIFSSDGFDILGGDSAGLFDFKHTPKELDRAATDFVAKRKPCTDFNNYEPLLKSVQADLSKGKRKLIDFNLGNLREGAFYIHNGILFLLETIEISHKEHYRDDGTRVREDGRTRCIFENGTQSNMLKRSVEKILYDNGKVVTVNMDKVNEGFTERFSSISEEDEAAGYIYVLKSKSTDNRISSISDLFKIGYSKIEVHERIKNAEKEPTYLFAPVEYIAGWKCYNMNPQKFELLIHNFFGSCCLEADVFDEKGKRYTPREWFIAPLDIIEQAIALIISGKVVKYKYVVESKLIVER